MPIETISQMIDKLLQDKIIKIDNNRSYVLTDYIKTELASSLATERDKKLKALETWLDNTDIFPNITQEQHDTMEKAIDQFLDKVFVVHGAASYRLLGTPLSHEDFDINSIADEISEMYPKQTSFVREKLSTIFSLYTI